ncbi:MAG: chromosomal replication initiator protein DnaA [Geminicoccaceae bacterium]
MTPADGNSHDPELYRQWDRVRSVMRDELGDALFATWMEPLSLDRLEGDRVFLTTPTRFLRDWVERNYADRLRALWTSVNGSVRRVAIDVRLKPAHEAERGLPDEPASAPLPRDARVNGRPDGSGAHGHLPAGEPSSARHAFDELRELSAALDPRLTFDDFVIGKPNEFAFAAAKRVAETPVPAFNPLFLYGGVGLGKTHLMHAIAWHIRQQHPERRVVYLSAEKFMYQFIKALRTKDTMTFKDMLRAVDVLMVDDVQFISGKDSTQEEFFHTFNTLVDRGSQIVISADRSPSDLSGIEERIRSRLGWGLVADIHPTTFELRLGILQQKALKLPGAEIPQEVLEFLAQRITSNVRELEGALNRIVAQATLVNRAITISVAQDVLQDLLRANDRRVTVEEIQKRVADFYQLRVADLLSARRSRAVARPRQVAMFLAKQLTPRSLPEIGRQFGNRDHTTVMHAVRTIERLCDEDTAIAEDVDTLRRQLQA